MILRAVWIDLRAVDRKMMPETAPRRNDDLDALPSHVMAAAPALADRRFRRGRLNHSLQKLYRFQQIEGIPDRSLQAPPIQTANARRKSDMRRFGARKGIETGAFLFESGLSAQVRASIHNSSDMLSIPGRFEAFGTEP